MPAWTIEPARDEEALGIMIDVFVESGYEIKAVLRTIFNSDFFKDARYAKIKSPAEVVANTLNLVGAYQVPDPTMPSMGLQSIYMGQTLLDPPSVEGWYTGKEWINSGSLLARINFLADRVADTSMPVVERIIAQIRDDGVTGPEDLMEACLEHMGLLELNTDTRDLLLGHVRDEGDLDWSDQAAAGIRIGELLALVGATTEYQFN